MLGKLAAWFSDLCWHHSESIPAEAFALIQYIDLIYRAYVDFLGHEWLLYDEGFCMRAVMYPEMHRDMHHHGL